MKNSALLLNIAFTATAVFFAISSGWSQSPTPVQNFGASPRAYTTRKSFWTEFNLGGTLSANKKWQYQIDYQYRRAADASYIQGGAYNNIFKESYQQVVRPWIHYWVVPGSVRLSLSPIGYWITWTPSQETSLNPNKDGVKTGQSVFPEFRICPQVTTIHNIGRVQFIQRYRYEFRYLGERRAADNNFSDLSKGYDFAPTNVGDQSAALGWYGHNHVGRLRLQTRLQVPLNGSKVVEKTWYINTWNELFLANGRHVKNDKLLNQNRFVAMLGYRFKGEIPIKIEGGITYQTLFNYNIDTPPNDAGVTYQKSNVENNTAFTIYVICDEFHKLFKKKSESQKE